MNWIEWIGYAGSALVAVSLMMSAIVRLRLLNLAGALIFALYGALVGAMPVLLVNLLMHMSPQYSADVRVTIQHGEKICRICHHLLIQPLATYGNGLMVQAYQRIQSLFLRHLQGAIEQGQLRCAEFSAYFTGHLRIQHQYLPVRHPDLATQSGGSIRHRLHLAKIIVIAW